jgi:hypothetical protein
MVLQKRLAGNLSSLLKKTIMKTKQASGKAGAKKKSAKKDIAASYNQYKFYNGKQYTGMKIGRSHTWLYDQGQWKEKKITPERWEIDYSVVKRRKGRAPEGSGVPVGTQYHWFILAHQYVSKLNANDYTTELKGLKLKVAHKRASSDKWSITKKGQRKKLIAMLKDFIRELESEPVEMEETPVKKIPRKKTAATRSRKAA